MAAFWGEDEEEQLSRPLMDIGEGEDDPTPPFAVVEFLNLEKDHIFEKVQCRRGGVARQVLENAVVQMKATYSPAQLSGIQGWVTREEEAARLCGDTNRYVLLMKNENEPMNLAENFDPEKGAIPTPEYINGQEYRTFSFYVDLGKVYDGPSQPVFKLARTDITVRNRFKLAIKLNFLDREDYICESPIFRCRTRRREQTPSISEPSTPSSQDAVSPPEVATEPQSPAPQSPAVSSTFQTVITDSLVARTALIDDLVYGQAIQSPNHDIAYHLKIKDEEVGKELEEGDVVGFFTDEEEGGTYVKLLRSNDIENAIHAGVVSRSYYLAANKMPEEEGATETVCVIGIVDVKVNGSVENGERVYASIDRPGKAIPQSHLPVGSFLRKKHALLGMSMERKTSKSLDDHHLVKCFVCIVLDVGRKDILEEVEEMYELTEKSTQEQIRYAAKKAWRRLKCCFAISLVLLVLLVILLYQVFVPGSMFRYWLCRHGSLDGELRVTIVPYSSITTRISVHGIRFSYEGLNDKVPDNFARNDKTGHSEVYYFLNLDRCAYFGDKGTVRNWLTSKYKDIGGGEVLSINYNCTTVYWYGLQKNKSELGIQWYPYISAQGLECTPNPPY